MVLGNTKVSARNLTRNAKVDGNTRVSTGKLRVSLAILK